MLENGKMGRLRWGFKHVFTVIRGLRPANLDYRNKSGNDRRGEVVAFGNERCLKRWFGICCKFFKYPSPDTNVSTSPSRGEVYNNRPFSVIRGPRPANLDQLVKPVDNIKEMQSGRSMIEMLGVLAIIGVLSVGGIAGYSKAMEKWKFNKIVADYNMLIRGLLEYRESIINSIKGQTGEILINNLIVTAGIVPENWKIEGRYLDDNQGNLIYPYAINDARYISESRIVLDFNLNGLAKNENGANVSVGFSDKLCMEIFNNLVIPLHNVLMCGYVFPYTETLRYGDKYCKNNKKCLSDLTLEEVRNICNVCDKTNKRCNITIAF